MMQSREKSDISCTSRAISHLSLVSFVEKVTSFKTPEASFYNAYPSRLADALSREEDVVKILETFVFHEPSFAAPVEYQSRGPDMFQYD